MNRVWIDFKEIPPYPPAEGAAPAERYFTLQGTELRLVDAAGHALVLAKGSMVQISGDVNRDDVAAAKSAEAKRYGGRDRSDPAARRAALDRRRKADKAARKAKQLARRRL